MAPASPWADHERGLYAAFTPGCINDQHTHHTPQPISRDSMLTSSPSFGVGGHPHMNLAKDIGEENKECINKSQENVAEERGDFCREASADKMKSSQLSQQRVRSCNSRGRHSAQTSTRGICSESQSIHSPETTTDSQEHDSSLSKLPDTIAAMMKRALFKKSEIENRQSTFSKLKHNKSNSSANGTLYVEKENREYMIQEPVKRRHREADNCETSSDDVCVSYNYSRPRLRSRKCKQTIDRRNNSSTLGRKVYKDVTYTVQKTSFVFEHPEATYLLTKIPKTNIEDTSEIESSSSPAEEPIRRKSNRPYTYTVSKARQRPNNNLTVRSEEPSNESKKPFEVYKNHVNRSWQADVQAIYAAVNHITPPSSAQLTKKFSKRHRRPWSPQREPKDQGIVHIHKSRSPAQNIPYTYQASGCGLKDRGTSPHPQPAVIHRGVTYTIDRGTSPFPRMSSFDKQISMEEPSGVWKDLETKNNEKIMKNIARLSEIHPPNDSCMNPAMELMPRKRKYEPSIYPDSPPPKALRDKGIVAFSESDSSPRLAPTNVDPTEMDSEWSGHSIVISEFMNNIQSTPNQFTFNGFWQSPYAFEVLGTCCPMQQHTLKSKFNGNVNGNVENRNLRPVNATRDAQSSVTWQDINNYIVEFESDTTSKTNSSQPEVNKNKECEIQEISSTLNDDKTVNENDSKTVGNNPDSSETKVVIRSAWHLPQNKKKPIDSFEDVILWEPPTPEPEPEPDDDNKSLTKMRPVPRRLHVHGCPGACGGNKNVGGCILLRKHQEGQT